jgi:glycine/D-amino acid oxidase-like deaminating enzyme
VYTADTHRVDTFRNEARIASQLGLPATFEKSTELPFAIKAAVKFAHQAKFNAVAYTYQLAQRIQGGGSYVFEQSPATSLSERPQCRVVAKHGTISAKHIVVATKIPPSPLAARFSYGLIEYPQTSYLIAGTPTSQLKGMYISSDRHHYSLLHTGKHLLIGGEKHIPGLGLPGKHYRKLFNYGQQHFGFTRKEYQWKAMDYIAYDNLPVIGKLYPWSHNMYAVTGFKKWGLSTSMVAAKIIHDLIHQQTTPEAKLFYPHRMGAPLAIPRALRRDGIFSF